MAAVDEPGGGQRGRLMRQRGRRAAALCCHLAQEHLRILRAALHCRRTILLIQILGLALFRVEYARRTLDSIRQ